MSPGAQTFESTRPAGSSPRSSRLGLAAAGAILGLALVEGAVALSGPSRAPSEADWREAVAAVRAGFAPGDLVVAAPAWADPVLRLHLGDLVPREVAGRLDAGRFRRIWELSQRGARSAEADAGAIALERRFGALTLRRVDRPEGEAVRYDFVERWREAVVAQRDAGGAESPCVLGRDRFACPEGADSFVRRATLEVDGTLHLALEVRPAGSAPLVLEFPAAALGSRIAVGAGLHNVWARKVTEGTVPVRVFVGGRRMAELEAGSGTGWTREVIDTAGLRGQTLPVRFEIRSSRPAGRYLALAAEARE